MTGAAHKFDDFLKNAGWADSDVTPVTPDWSPRQYWRVEKAGRTAIFLQGPQEDFRGHGLKDFVEIGRHLKTLGLSTPEIYAQDLSNARLLLEDFGNTPIDTPAIERDAYEAAVDVLKILRTEQNVTPTLARYEDAYVFKKTELFATNYAKGEAASWMDAWKQVTSALPACPHVFSHIDYKAGNLHWLPERDGTARIGILDYQAAQNAPFVYDIMTLLEDARRTLPWDMKAHLKARYIAHLPEDWRPLFDLWYPVIAAQFHAGVLGQITGRDHIPSDMPARLESYLRDELQTPVLNPVRDWCQRYGVII